MVRNIFLAFGVVGVGIMIPVNVTQTKTFAQASWGLSALSYMTPQFTYGSGLWAQVVVAYIGNFIVAYFLWHNYRRVFALRRTYFTSPDYQSSLHARTLVVRDLKPDLRNPDGVVRVTDEVNPTGVQPVPSVGRNVKGLPDLIEEHEEKVRELESALAKYLKYPERLPARRPMMKPSGKYNGPTTGGKVDSIDYLSERIKELEIEIKEVRDQIDTKQAMPYAFVSWDQIAQAHTVAFASRRKRPQGAKLELAPAPTDLIWKNMAVGRASRKSRRFMNGIWIAVLTIVWTPLNAAIAIFLSNLGNLGAVWPSFKTSLESNPVSWGIVQAILAPTLTSLVYMVLPVIFRRLQVKAGDITKTEREQHVVRNLYTFFILNNLVLFSVFSAIWAYVADIIVADNEGKSTWDAILAGKFFQKTTNALCEITPFFVTFLLQRNLGAALDLAQLWRVFLTWFQRRFMSPTPRQNIEWTAPVPFEYSSYYNYFLFYATIAISFATLQPIVLLVAALYFTLDAVLKKYLMMYIYVTKNESGGQMWRVLVNRLIFACMLLDVVVIVLLVGRDEYIKAGVMGPGLLLLLGFKMYCAKAFDRDMIYFTTKGMLDQEANASGKSGRRRAEKMASKFGHPALGKPLMTPMVHAKAQHIFSEIYHGRVGSDGHGHTTENAFSDAYQMQPMKNNSVPQTDSGAPAVEFVSEAKQDFAYYKNREDFRDEAGANLIDDDAMTERSGTPFSQFRRTNTAGTDQQLLMSGSSSRAASPAPGSGSRPMSPANGIRRKEVAAAANNRHSQMYLSQPAYQSESDLSRVDTATSQRDIALGPRQHGYYTDPDADDRAGLLSQQHEVSMAQFRATPSGMTPGRDDGGQYDYFRAPKGQNYYQEQHR
jgi:calcium permeable stress-gated cation channel